MEVERSTSTKTQVIQEKTQIRRTVPSGTTGMIFVSNWAQINDHCPYMYLRKALDW